MFICGGPAATAAADRRGDAARNPEPPAPLDDVRPQPAAPERELLPASGPPALHAHHPDLGIDLDRHPRPARHRAAGLVGHLSLRHRRPRRCSLMRARERRVAADRARGHSLAIAVRDPAILPQLQLRLRAPRHYITSGLVAVVFALADGAQFARSAGCSSSSGSPAASSLGSAVALAGVALLFVQEMRASQRRSVRSAARHRPDPARRALGLGRQRHAGRRADAEPADRGDARLGHVLRRARQRALPPGPCTARRWSRRGSAIGRLALSRPVRLGARLHFLFRIIRARSARPGRPIRACWSRSSRWPSRPSSKAIAGRPWPSPAALLALAGLVIALRSRKTAT